jgi:hypothetical protein
MKHQNAPSYHGPIHIDGLETSSSRPVFTLVDTTSLTMKSLFRKFNAPQLDLKRMLWLIDVSSKAFHGLPNAITPTIENPLPPESGDDDAVIADDAFTPKVIGIPRLRGGLIHKAEDAVKVCLEWV